MRTDSDHKKFEFDSLRDKEKWTIHATSKKYPTSKAEQDVFMMPPNIRSTEFLPLPGQESNLFFKTADEQITFLNIDISNEVNDNANER